jgi:hypothetical protein
MSRLLIGSMVLAFIADMVMNILCGLEDWKPWFRCPLEQWRYSLG